MTHDPTTPWQIWVDTGGTFTDAVGLDPRDRLHRTKVLSSSALRVRVEERPDARSIRPAPGWEIPIELVRGHLCRPLSRDGEAGSDGLAESDLPELRGSGRDAGSHRAEPEEVSARIVEADPERGILILDRELDPIRLAAGDTLEITSDEEAPILACRLMTQTPRDRPLPPISLRLATTRGTNALLTRRGARTAFFVTRGFEDLLEIGTQQRPDIFSLKIEKSRPLYETVVGVSERVSSQGDVLHPLDLDPLEATIDALVAGGVETAAVALLHADRHPEHERRLGDFLRARGFQRVALSSEVAPSIQILPRAETTVVEAYLAPVIQDYLAGIEINLKCGSPLVLTSAGGLVRSESFRAKDSLLSGPAGGVVGAARAGLALGLDRILSFDMGGTSTDIARFDGDYEYVFEHQVGEAKLRAPSLAVESVAAGGGSICRFDGVGLAVGPESAGAVPGPACYGAGGPLTLTDCNLLLGRLDPARFGVPLEEGAARRAALRVLEELHRSGASKLSLEELLDGFLRLANEKMAAAVRRVSFRRGYDPAEYVLVAFGGAGGQHACAMAAGLGISRVLVPPDPGLLSAFGLGRAKLERFASDQVLKPLITTQASIPGRLRTLSEEAIRLTRRDAGADAKTVRVRRRIAQLRFAGQESSLEVEIDQSEAIGKQFLERYVAVFGHRPADREVELVSLRVIASTETVAREGRNAESGPDRSDEEQDPADRERSHPQENDRPGAVRSAFFSGGWRDVPVLRRDRLRESESISGPALIFEAHSAVVVEPGWRLTKAPNGGLLLTCGPPAGGAHRASGPDAHPTRSEADMTQGGSESEAVRASLLANRFETIAGEMGEQLRRTAVSTNVKERLDFSCAILDPDGRLVVNAPHIPVHLGSLGLCLRSVRKVVPLNPGDVVVTNHPEYGGSHLPDLTVITPVFTDPPAGSEPRLLGYVASRAHHAEIGGRVPGSMPAQASCLAEEGVVIPPTYLVKGGRSLEDRVRAILADAPFPSRRIEDNLADLRAAVAANQAGVQALRRLAETEGPASLLHYMRVLEKQAESRIRAAIRDLPDGRFETEEAMDDGSPIRVTVEIRGDTMEIDFTGSAALHPGNLNATEAIVRSVVVYVLRLLVRESTPLNEGLMAPIELKLPEGMLRPSFPDDPLLAPAVFGGNVETSQRIADALLRSLRLSADSQGTMNNLVFGNDRFSYYETIGGGAGAGPDFDGASGVHTHMTNTRITDPETLELLFPVRLERFSLRRGSGGLGRFRGGDGLVRDLTFLEPLSVSILSQRRARAPRGLLGGGDALPGRQVLIRATGERIPLGAIEDLEVGPGDRLTIETPGGGGFGSPEGCGPMPSLDPT